MSNIAAVITLGTALLTFGGIVLHGIYKFAGAMNAAYAAVNTLISATRENTGAIRDLTGRQEAQDRRLWALEQRGRERGAQR